MSQVGLAALARQVGETTIVGLDNNQSISGSTKTTISWESASHDDLGAWDSASPSELTVPDGVTRVMVHTALQWQANDTGIRDVWFTKNGVDFPGMVYERKTAAGISSTHIATPIIPVVAGDFFRVRVYQDSGGSLTVNSGDETHFAMAALG